MRGMSQRQLHKKFRNGKGHGTVTRPRVVVFYGGDFANADLSTESGLWVCNCIPRSTYDVTPVEVTPEGLWKVPLGVLPRSGSVSTTLHRLSEAIRPLNPIKALERLVERPVHALMTLVRGKGGDDGTLHAIGSMLNVPVVGSSMRAFQQSSDKHLFQQAVADLALTPYSRLFSHQEPLDEILEDIRDDFLPPLFLKPASAEGSYGTEYITSLDDLRSSVSRILSGDDLLVQERVAGHELSLSIMKDARGRLTVLPPTLIRHEHVPFYTQLAKRKPGLVSIYPTDHTSGDAIQEAQDIARDVYENLNYEGLVTMDMIAGDEGITLLEANMVPTFTAYTPLRSHLKAAGMHPTSLLDQLLRSTLGYD